MRDHDLRQPRRLGSRFVLGLLAAYFFAVVLKGTPFALPPSGRVDAGVRIPDLATVWGLQNLTGHCAPCSTSSRNSTS